MFTHTFSGAKGGVGTTTVAVLAADAYTARGHGVLLVTDDNASTRDFVQGNDDALAVMGIATPKDPLVEVYPGNVGAGVGPLWVAVDEALAYEALASMGREVPWDVVVRDAGTSTMARAPRPDARRTLVLRNDYLAIRRAVPRTDYDTVVLLLDNERALTSRDVAEVLGAMPVLMAVDPKVARMTDAGLLMHRKPTSVGPIGNVIVAAEAVTA